MVGTARLGVRERSPEVMKEEVRVRANGHWLGFVLLLAESMSR